MANKYQPLERHLRNLDSAEVEVTLLFSELKRMLGSDLPNAAFDHRAWWGNQINNATRPQARAWMNAGFVVEAVRQSRESGWVTLKRQQLSRANERLAPDGKAARSIVQRPKAWVPNLVGQEPLSVYLVSCVKEKGNLRAPARDLYVSNWFRKARAFVESSGMPWFILSAEYGLVEPNQIIEPYENTLSAQSSAERRAWSQKVVAQMELALPNVDRVVLLAGIKYREFLMDYLTKRYTNVHVPMRGLKIGEQLS
jgi:hypothetical protein